MAIVPEARAITFISTTDRARAEAFYGDVLELPELSLDEYATIYDMGGGAILRLTSNREWESHEYTVLGWSIPDIDTTMAQLRAKGLSSSCSMRRIRTSVGSGRRWTAG
ncbi:VOC family protein [Novosphingobium resinovorum]